MGTYDSKKLIVEYSNERMDVTMAMGHSLQHIDKLYTAQAAANIDRYQIRDKVDTLESQLKALQAQVDRLTALQENSPGRSTRPGESSGDQPKDRP